MSTTNMDHLRITSRLRIPTYNQTQINALTSLSTGTIVFNTSIGRLQFWDGSEWKVNSAA